MAEPARKYPDPAAVDPRTIDPINPVPAREPAGARLRADNDPRVDHRAIAAAERQYRGSGNGAIVVMVGLLLAAVAYFMFAPGSQTPAPAEPPAATAPAAPAQPAPDAMAPAAPAPAAPAN